MELIIGSRGFIGGALLRHLPDAAVMNRPQFNLLDLPTLVAMPGPVSIAYLCAGANGAKACEGSQDAFRANVDGPVELAKELTRAGVFMVFISSMSIEWLGTAYQRQKLAAETALRTMPGVGIVRAGRVLPGNVDDLCATLIRVGRDRIEGVTRWGNDDIAYQR